MRPICGRRCGLWVRLANLVWRPGELLTQITLAHAPPRTAQEWKPIKVRIDPDDLFAWPRRGVMLKGGTRL